MRVLIVEDDKAIASFVAKGLAEAGFAVDPTGDGKTGLERALATPYDVAIVDVMLPGIDGLTLVETLRQRGVRTPVLILSARHTVDDRVRGLQAGGDDYLVKPFAFPELLARVQALVRRASAVSEPTRLVAGDIEMDLLSREVRRGGLGLSLVRAIAHAHGGEARVESAPGRGARFRLDLPAAGASLTAM